ncbi:TIGR03546 family protein [Treponema phagedenis]|uniref:TIGR03546 family protein n=1 Tax=Treponema phagedenis TaxID=162 RepID=A0AAE6IWN7_TREPH|nr:TIGR03546 family protein [Treponema phagedenis]NVP24061.1 TIGR03546 family protein [Treponema phagedenis]QEJ99370.1 TIGR03546 family protein [Treponema phagedenis]QKS93359.1 TIGR03546 family protein [Treponema phagedenis]QLC59588.1 TIGR03546 family protein [Treponema phagedenis]QSH95355.1 TIGR03546 family protein [Treponema phagedenis]
MIQYVASFFKSINANNHPGDIAHAVALGLFLAILPKDNLTFVFLFFFTFFIRVNTGAFFISFILLGFLTPFLDVLINRIGFFIVPLQFLRPGFILLENTPFIALFKLSNTMVAGGIVLGLILYVPCYMLTRFLVGKYRKHMQPSVSDIKGSGFISKIPLLKHLVKISELKEKFYDK